MARFVLEGLDHLERIDSLFRRVDEYAAAALDGGADAVAGEAKRLAPSGSTGHLAASVRVNCVEGSFVRGTLEAEVVADAPHAAALEFGSGIHGERGEPYPIFPKHKKALRWPVQGRIGVSGAASSGYAFAKGVMHPGVKAQRFLERAAEAKADVVAEEIAAAIELAIEGD